MDHESFERSGDVLKDQLNMYYGSYFYDISFKVGAMEPKIIKCHKLILARACAYFEKMFMSSFEESLRDKDDPIVMSSSSPEAFDAAMKYIYGNETNFSSVEMACEIFKLAHLWNIKGLMDACGKHFKKAGPGDILLVYDLINLMDSYMKMEMEDYCKVIIEDHAEEVFGSSRWVNTSYATVLRIFEVIWCLDTNFSQEEQLDALIKWGAYNADSNDHLKIREKVDEALKLIDFFALSVEDFAKIALKSNILHENEKNQIFISIALHNPRYMPLGFQEGYEIDEDSGDDPDDGDFQ